MRYYCTSDENDYNKVKEKVIKIYPELKEKYGKHRYIDKYINQFFDDNDYNF